MIKRADQMVSEIREKMRGGEGSVEILHLFKMDEMKGKARLVAKIRLKAGCSIGFHEHNEEEEIYYILSGNGEVNDGGNIAKVGPGDAVLTGNGAGHSITNAGSEPLDFMGIIILYK